MTQAKWMHHNKTDHFSATWNYETLKLCKSSIKVIYKVDKGSDAQQQRMRFYMTDKWTKTLKIFLWPCRDATLNLLQNSCQRWKILYLCFLFCTILGKKDCYVNGFVQTDHHRGVLTPKSQLQPIYLFLICFCMTYTVLGYTCVAYSVSVCMYKIVTTQKVKPFLRQL